MSDKLASLIEVKNYFGHAKLTEFKKDWEKLDDDSRLQLRTGIGNGTLTY